MKLRNSVRRRSGRRSMMFPILRWWRNMPSIFHLVVTWSILLCLSVICFMTLAYLEEQQATFQKPNRADAVAASRAAKHKAAIQKCIAQEPFLHPKKGLMGLEQLADGADDAVLRAWSASKETEGLAQCVYAWRSMEDARMPSRWEQVFTEGTSLNMGLRISKILLLAVFALCLSEILLRLLKFLNVPVVSLTDIGKSFGIDPTKPALSNAPDSAPKPTGSWITLVGTTLITGLTSATVVAPEIVKQAVTSSHVAERYAETRIRSEHRQQVTTVTDIKRILEIQREINKTQETGANERLNDRLSAIDTKTNQLQLDLEALRRTEVTERWNAIRAVLDKGIRVSVSSAGAGGTPVAPVPSKDPVLTQLELMAKAEQIEGLKKDLVATQTRLQQEIDVRQQTIAGATNSMQAMALALRQRTCALFVYFDDLEKNRMWFSKEASNRIQLMRDVMGKNEVTADCRDFSPQVAATPAAPAAPAAAAADIRTSAQK